MPKINVEKIHSLTGHKDCLYTITGDEQNRVYTSGGDGLIVEWSLDNPEIGKMIAKFTNSVYSLYYIKESHQLLIGQNFEGVHRLDLNSKGEEKSKKITDTYIFDILQIGESIFCVCGDGRLLILNTSDLSLKKVIQLSKNSLRCITYSEKLEQIAIGSSDNSIYILDAYTLETVCNLKSHTNSVFTLAYHPNDQYLISAGRDAHLKIWETKEYNLADEIVAHMYAINNIKFSPDGDYFASCSMDKSIKIWDANKFKLLKVIDKARHAGHGTSVNKLWWKHHQKKLLSVSDDRTASLWDIQIEN